MSGRSSSGKTVSSILATRHHEDDYQLSHMLSVPIICSQIETVCADVDKKMHFAVLSSAEKERIQRNKLHRLRSNLARSRTGVWGPTHSSDSDSESEGIRIDETCEKGSNNPDHHSACGSIRNQMTKYQCSKTCNESGTPNTSTTREETLSLSNCGNNNPPNQDILANLGTASPAAAPCAGGGGGWSPTLEKVWDTTVDIFQQWSRKPCLPCGAESNRYTYLKDDDPISKHQPQNLSRNASNINSTEKEVHDLGQKTMKCITKGMNSLEACGDEYEHYTYQRNQGKLRKDPKFTERQFLRISGDSVVTPTTSQSSSCQDENLKNSPTFSRRNIPKNNLLDNEVSKSHTKHQSSSNKNEGENRFDDENALAAAKAAAAQIIYQQQNNKQKKSNDSPQGKSIPPPSSPCTTQHRIDARKNLSSPKSGKENKPPPIAMLEISPKMYEFEKSVSELTMRSCNGGHQQIRQLSETRRMAYYAVGKRLLDKSHSSKNQQRPGGNRTCYLTGQIILGGKSPFYAGCVQQGLRTLVVFCAPAALGFPTREALKREGIDISPDALNSSESTSSLTKEFAAMDQSRVEIRHEDIANIPLDTLINALPVPSNELLQTMKQKYGEQYKTLPVQLRSEKCWKIYVKFCFFSGLPIAESDVHYRVRSDVLKEFQDQEEEISLSHEVMVIVNGEQSADILRLPNKKTFQYLRKHYQHQSTKLPSKIFERVSWEMVMPEV